MDRKPRAILFLGFAFIDFFIFRSTGMKVLGALFLFYSVYLLATGPKLTKQ